VEKLSTAQQDVDLSGEIKKAYVLRAPDAAWPPTSSRLDNIYSTLQRALRGERDRRPLIQKLLEIAHEWDGQCPVVLQEQESFDAWFFSQVESICRVPFTWSQAPKKGVPVIEHQQLSFGAAQKFLNLLLKDWWARSEQATQLGAMCDNLHAPHDDIVMEFVSRARPTLSVPSSVVYELDKETYVRLQGVINQLSDELQHALRCGCKLARIEFEQLVWGWIK
jgi:hypothetical protein